MADTSHRLQLVIEAATARAHARISALESHLRRVQSQGGLRGLGAGGMLGGLTAARAGMGLLGTALSGVTAAFPVLLGAGRFALRGLLFPLKLVTTAIGSIPRLLRTVRTSMFGVLALAGTAAAGVYAGMKALGPAAYRETSRLSWRTLLGSDRAAGERMDFIERFNVKTPFDFRELDTGARLMETFGLYSERNLRVVGDAVSAFGKRIEEAVGPLAKLKAGLWETESLATIGLTREALRGEGVEFNKQGSLVTPGDQAFEAAIAYFEKRFGGMMERTATTFRGLLSTLRSNIDAAFGGLTDPLDRAKNVVRELIRATRELAPAMASVKAPWIDTLADAVKGAKFLLRDLTTPEGRAQMKTAATDTAGNIAAMLPGLGRALARDIGTVFGGMVESFGRLTPILIEGLMGAFRYGAALLSEMWQGASLRLRDAVGAPFSDAIRARMELTEESGIRSILRGDTRPGTASGMLRGYGGRFAADALTMLDGDKPVRTMEEFSAALAGMVRRGRMTSQERIDILGQAEAEIDRRRGYSRGAPTLSPDAERDATASYIERAVRAVASEAMNIAEGATATRDFLKTEGRKAVAPAADYVRSVTGRVREEKEDDKRREAMGDYATAVRPFLQAFWSGKDRTWQIANRDPFERMVQRFRKGGDLQPYAGQAMLEFSPDTPRALIKAAEAVRKRFEQTGSMIPPPEQPGAKAAVQPAAPAVVPLAPEPQPAGQAPAPAVPGKPPEAAVKEQTDTLSRALGDGNDQLRQIKAENRQATDALARIETVLSELSDTLGAFFADFSPETA